MRLAIEEYPLDQVIDGVEQIEACCDDMEEMVFVRAEVVRGLGHATEMIDGKNNAQDYSDTHGCFVNVVDWGCS